MPAPVSDFMSESAIAAFGDIHSNLEALEAVLADMDALGVQRRVCLGDIVGYAANPGKCLKLVRSLGCPVLKGNHDALAANDDALDDMRDVAEVGIKFARQKLTIEEREYLGGLALTMADGDCEFVHASLNRPEDWTYLVRREELREHFKAQTRRIASLDIRTCRVFGISVRSANCALWENRAGLICRSTEKF